MTRSINDIYNLIRFIIRKQRGIYLSADEIMSNLDAAQLEAFEDDFKPYAVNQTFRDSLAPFKVNKQFISASDGSVTFESDYMHFLDSCYTIDGSAIYQVRFVSEDEKAFALASQMRQVSVTYPIAENTATGFQLYPQTAQTGFYAYLRRPATPVLAFTQAGRTVTYNAAASTQLEWRDNFINNIIARALAYSGVFMDDDKIIQFSELKQAQTNP